MSTAMQTRATVANDANADAALTAAASQSLVLADGAALRAGFIPAGALISPAAVVASTRDVVDKTEMLSFPNCAAGKILRRLQAKQLFSVLMLTMLIFTFGLTALSAPAASAACPIEGCQVPPQTLPIPPTRKVIFYVYDQDTYGLRVISLKMTYYTVSGNQYVQLSRTAYPTDQYNPPLTNYFQMHSNFGSFKAVKPATSKPTTSTAYGQYANGQYGYKTTTIQAQVPYSESNYCYKWTVYADNSTIMAKGFYPLPECS